MNMHRFLNCINAISINNIGVDAKLFPSFERDLKLEERVLNDILHPEFSEKFPEKGFIRICGLNSVVGWRIVGNTGSFTGKV